MLPVVVRKPAVSIVLLKNVGRKNIAGQTPVSERFAGQNKSIDLTPYLGEQGAVNVRKSVREPAGTFSITLTDQIDTAGQDSLYGLIEPMDVIEIRMASDEYKFSAQALPIMMRGFVSRVRRNELMQNDGKPMRRVTITGQDYGKIWQILQVFYLPNAPQGENYITSFPFFSKFGVEMQTQSSGDFVKDVVNKVINPYIKKMAALNNDSPIVALAVDAQENTGGVSPWAVGPWQGGKIHDLLIQNCDVGAWNELYIEDREAAPTLVYRRNPFKRADGKGYVRPQAVEPITTEIGRDDVLLIDAERTDENVSNYFWVDAVRFNINYDVTQRALAYQGSAEDYFVENYGNIDPALYGSRKLWQATSQCGAEEKNSGNGTQKGADRTLAEDSAKDWMSDRRRLLKEQNKDNVVFESGTIRMKGNHDVKAGTYVRLRNGSMLPEYYAHSVSHDYTAYGSYVTTVSFERGTGFIERSKKEGGKATPYWAELAE